MKSDRTTPVPAARVRRLVSRYERALEGVRSLQARRGREVFYRTMTGFGRARDALADYILARSGTPTPDLETGLDLVRPAAVVVDGVLWAVVFIGAGEPIDVRIVKVEMASVPTL